MRKRKQNKWGCPGVSLVRSGYKAEIKVGNKVEYLGVFSTPEEAGNAYKKRHIEVHGEVEFSKEDLNVYPSYTSKSVCSTRNTDPQETKDAGNTLTANFTDLLTEEEKEEFNSKYYIENNTIKTHARKAAVGRTISLGGKLINVSTLL